MLRLSGAQLLLLAWGAVARGDAIDRGLIDNADKLVAACVKAGYKSIGVVRFRVNVPGGPSGYREPLSSNLADRVENLLIATDVEGKIKGVIRGIGAQAARRDEKANLKTLFAYKYDLAWGKEGSKADAILLGKVGFTAGLKEAKVEIDGQTAEDEFPVPLVSFKVEVDRDMLADAGLRFTISDHSLSASAMVEKARELALKAAKDDTGSATPVPLVTLQVYREGKMIPQLRDYHGSGLFQAEETEGKLAFKLTNSGKQQVGIVFRVAGRGAIEKETEQFSLCRKLLLEAGKSVTLSGHLTRDGAGKQTFRVIPVTSPVRAAGGYAPQMEGLLELAVFVSGKDEEKPGYASLRGFGIDGLGSGSKWTRRDLATELRLRARLEVAKVVVRESKRPDVPVGSLPALEGTSMKNPRFVEAQRFLLTGR